MLRIGVSNLYGKCEKKILKMIKYDTPSVKIAGSSHDSISLKCSWHGFMMTFMIFFYKTGFYVNNYVIISIASHKP